MCRGRNKNWPLVSRDVYYYSSVYVIYDFMQVWHSRSCKSNPCVTCWLNKANEWSMSWAPMRRTGTMSLYHNTWPPHAHTHTHTMEGRILFKVQIKPSCVWLCSWSHQGGKAQEGLRLPPPTPPLLPVFACLYFNSSPGAASLLNTFSDIFSDHFFNAGTCGEPAIKNVHKEKRFPRSTFDEYFSSEIWVSL